jgi:hypothetical protein
LEETKRKAELHKKRSPRERLEQNFEDFDAEYMGRARLPMRGENK